MSVGDDAANNPAYILLAILNRSALSLGLAPEDTVNIASLLKWARYYEEHPDEAEAEAEQ